MHCAQERTADTVWEHWLDMLAWGYGLNRARWFVPRIDIQNRILRLNVWDNIMDLLTPSICQLALNCFRKFAFRPYCAPLPQFALLFAWSVCWSHWLNTILRSNIAALLFEILIHSLTLKSNIPRTTNSSNANWKSLPIEITIYFGWIWLI